MSVTPDQELLSERVHLADDLAVFELPVLSVDHVCDYNERKVSLDDRAEEIILRIEQKYGAWYKDEDESKNDYLSMHHFQGNQVWRKEMLQALKQALSQYPVTLIKRQYSSHDGVIACVVSGANIVLLKHNLQIVSKTSVPALQMGILRDGLPINDARSVFHWNRENNPGNAWIDPVFEEYCDKNSLFKANDKEPLWSGGILDKYCNFSSRKGFGSDIFKNSRGSIVSHTPDRFADIKITCAQYAVGAMITKINRSAQFAFNAAVRRLIYKPALNLARRFNNLDIYPWLIALDKQPILQQETPDQKQVDQKIVSMRRMQFALLYPELACFLVMNSLKVRSRSNSHLLPSSIKSSYHDDLASDYHALQVAIDHAQPLSSHVKKLRNWPAWVERHLRGKLMPTNAGGMFDGLENQFAQMLTVLGPEWRLRGGDSRKAAIILHICLHLKISIETIRNQTLPKGSSFWKQTYNKLPESFKKGMQDRILSRNKTDMYYQILNFTADISDCINSFSRDVVLPLCGVETYETYLGQTQSPSVLVKNFGLFKLIEISDQWHQRIQVIRRAKESGKAKHTIHMEDGWEPLFYPFSWIEGRIEVRPILNTSDLEDHGEQMQHCVGSYATSCKRGGCHIIGFYKDCCPVATAELAGYCGEQRQIRAIKNSNAGNQEKDCLDWISQQLRSSNRHYHMENQNVGLLCTDRPNQVRDHELQDQIQIDLDLVPPCLWTLPVSFLEEGANFRNKVLDSIQHLRFQEYDWNDPQAVERVLVAWRFAMPDSMRTAWEKGVGELKRVENVRTWLKQYA